MRNNRLFFSNMDFRGGCPYIFAMKFQLCQGFGPHLLSKFTSLMNSSIIHSNPSSQSSALQGAFSCISRFADSLFLWLSTVPNSNVYCTLLDNPCGSKLRNIQSWSRIEHVNSCIRNFMALQFGFGSYRKPAILMLFAEFENSTIRWLRKIFEQHQVFPMLSLAAGVVPPFDNLSSKVLSDLIPLKNNDERINSPGNQTLIGNDCQGGSSLSISKLNWKSDAIEPRTGIKFPTRLDSPLREDKSNPNLKVLVGIGSRSMRIIKVKSLQVYAFGLYVHPDTVCEKLGPKYASVPIGELEKCSNFFDDLLREDIHMTVRLVVNCKGLKVNTVRDAFEKSLRTRLSKMNPNTDYHCVSAFSAHFRQDIPLPVGTTIDFIQTTDGQLITEIEGKQIGAVHSKDLCRAFFDMYIGDVPVSVRTKQEIAQNVAGIIGRCYSSSSMSSH